MPLVRKLLGLDDLRQAPDDTVADGEQTIAIPQDHPLAPLVAVVEFVQTASHVRAADVVEMLAPNHLFVAMPSRGEGAWLTQALLDAGANVALPQPLSELLPPAARGECAYATVRSAGLGTVLRNAAHLARSKRCSGSAEDAQSAADALVRLDSQVGARSAGPGRVAPLALPSRSPTDVLPLVSICVAHKDAGEQLLLSVRSAAAQSYPSIEIVVVDGLSDPSEQGTFAEVGRLAASRGGVRMLSR